jgi:hypothetical protein
LAGYFHSDRVYGWVYDDIAVLLAADSIFGGDALATLWEDIFIPTANPGAFRLDAGEESDSLLLWPVRLRWKYCWGRRIYSGPDP